MKNCLIPFLLSYCPHSFIRVKVEKGGFSHTWAPICSAFSFSMTGFETPPSSAWVMLSQRNKFSLCTLMLIHVAWGIPSQLRSFHVNGAFIAPVHGLWKRGLLCRVQSWRKASTLILLSVSASLSFHVSGTRSLSLALFLLMSYSQLLE